MKYAINYVLGRETHVLVVDAPDRDDATLGVDVQSDAAESEDA
jgi:hypothetical protein